MFAFSFNPLSVLQCLCLLVATFTEYFAYTDPYDEIRRAVAVRCAAREALCNRATFFTPEALFCKQVRPHVSPQALCEAYAAWVEAARCIKWHFWLHSNQTTANYRRDRRYYHDNLKCLHLQWCNITQWSSSDHRNIFRRARSWNFSQRLFWSKF